MKEKKKKKVEKGDRNKHREKICELEGKQKRRKKDRRKRKKGKQERKKVRV